MKLKRLEGKVGNKAMKKTFRTVLGLAMLACMVTAPVIAVAQDDPGNTIIESLELDQADIRDALKIIFRATGLNYTVAADVQGVITVSLKDVPFKTALRNILNQVDSTWREEAGIYNIVRKPAVTAPTATDPGSLGAAAANPIRKIYIQHADPFLIALLLSGSGSVNSQPETSTSVGIGGGGQGGGQGGFGGGNGGFGGGQGGFGGGGQGGFGGGGGQGGFGGGGGGFGGFGGGGGGGGIGGF